MTRCARSAAAPRGRSRHASSIKVGCDAGWPVMAGSGHHASTEKQGHSGRSRRSEPGSPLRRGPSASALAERSPAPAERWTAIAPGCALEGGRDVRYLWWGYGNRASSAAWAGRSTPRGAAVGLASSRAAKWVGGVVAGGSSLTSVGMGAARGCGAGRGAPAKGSRSRQPMRSPTASAPPSIPRTGATPIDAAGATIWIDTGEAPTPVRELRRRHRDTDVPDSRWRPPHFMGDTHCHRERRSRRLLLFLSGGRWFESGFQSAIPFPKEGSRARVPLRSLTAPRRRSTRLLRRNIFRAAITLDGSRR